MFSDVPLWLSHSLICKTPCRGVAEFWTGLIDESVYLIVLIAKSSFKQRLSAVTIIIFREKEGIKECKAFFIQSFVNLVILHKFSFCTWERSSRYLGIDKYRIIVHKLSEQGFEVSLFLSEVSLLMSTTYQDISKLR